MPRNKPLDRRAFLKLAAASTAAAAVPSLLGQATAVRAAPDPIIPVLIEERPLLAADFTAGTLDGVVVSGTSLALQPGLNAGTFTSAVIKADKPFTHVSARWLADASDGLDVSIRSSSDGTAWSNWQTLMRETHTKTASGELFGVPASVGHASFVQVRFAFDRARGDSILRTATLTLLNAKDGPQRPPAESTPDTPSPTTGALYRREAWGADDTLRFDDKRNEIWARMYVPVKKVAVHHTATTNDYATLDDAKAEVRAVYAYHAVELGWGDIGYNMLIDKWGNVYEGRIGRGEGAGREVLSSGVVAGHALLHNYGSLGIALLGTYTAVGENDEPGIQPSEAQIKALVDMLTFECARNNIDPLGSSDFLLSTDGWNNDLHNIPGHRDCFNTICPGGYVYQRLPLIRSAVADALKRSPAVAMITYAGNRATQRTGPGVQFDWGADGTSRRFMYSLESWRKVAPDSEAVEYLAGFDADRKAAWKQTEQRSANLTQLWSDFGSRSVTDLPLAHYTVKVIGLDEQGKPGYQQDHTLLLTSGDLPPSVAIVSPAAGAALIAAKPVRLEASASDAEDGDLSYKVTWSSSKDGALGTGAILSKVLTAGGHKLSATVTDSNGVSATATVDVMVAS